MKTLRQRFWEKVAVGLPEMCWEWQASGWANGYGAFCVNGKNTTAHRAAWEIHNGPIPDGLHIDHICKNRRCVNPDHLRAVTPRDNVTLNSESVVAANRTKTHCSRGHEFNEDNTRWTGGTRSCRACRRMTRRSWQQRNPELIKEYNRRAYERAKTKENQL